MTEALLLPGQPPIEKTTVKIWAQIQRANWIECLNFGRNQDFFRNLRNPDTRGLLQTQTLSDRYVFSYTPPNWPFEEPNITVLRYEPENKKPVATVIYSWFGKSDISVKHLVLGNHNNSTRAVQIGLLEYIRYQQGKPAYDIALAGIKS